MPRVDSEVPRSCPICGAVGSGYGRIPASAHAGSIPLLRCPGCEHVWKAASARAPLVGTGAVATRDFSIRHAGLVRARLPREFSCSPGRRVLDVGCWDGALLADLPPTWVRHGIEPHAGAAALARKRGLTVFTRTLEAVELEPATYDVVVMMDILEHLAEPLAGLAKLALALRPGGYFIALTGNAASFASNLYRGSWYYFNYAEHVTFFSPESLRLGLVRTGFESIELRQVVHHAAALRVTVSRLLRRLRNTPVKGEDALPLPQSKRALLLLAASRLLRGRDHLLVCARKGTDG